jgi:hypothetical protein
MAHLNLSFLQVFSMATSLKGKKKTEAKCVSYANGLAVIDALMPMAFANLMSAKCD